MPEAGVGIEPKTVLFLILQSFPQAVLAAEKNIRRPNYNKPPEDGSRYNRKGHYHDYKFPVLSLFHTAELSPYKDWNQEPKLCVHFLMHMGATCSGKVSALHFITLIILHAKYKSPRPVLNLHCFYMGVYNTVREEGRILYICCAKYRAQL